MAVDGLGHVNIRTPLLEETLRFYEHALGLVRGDAATMDDQRRNAWLHTADGRPALHLNTLTEGEPDRPAGVTSRLDHIAFDCSDPAGTIARLDAHGIAYQIRETKVPGMVQYNLVDPNGIKVELTFGYEAVRRAP